MNSNHLSFIKENTKNGLHIPPTALIVSGIDGTPLEYRALPGAIVAFKSQMTAMELIDTIHALNRCASALFADLADTIGYCDDCDEQCGLTEENNFGYVFLPDELREQALQEGMITLRESASRLVREGVTSLREMQRITAGNVLDEEL